MRALAVAALGALALGCSSAGKDDRAIVLEELSSEVMLPSYVELDERASELALSVESYCTGPDASRLDAAKSSWRAARRAYRRTAAIQIGPAVDLGFSSAVDFWPVREADVDLAAAGAPDAPGPEYLSVLGVSARGLPALEYLLFDPADASIALGADTPEARKRCAFATALARDVRERAAQLRSAWDGDDGYAGQLAQAGKAASAVALTRDGVDLLLNSATACLVDLTDRTLGRPLGEQSGGVPQPGECESRYSGDSMADYDAALTSLRRVWIGALQGEQGRGLTLLVRQRSIPFDESVRAQILLTAERAGSIADPLGVAISSNALSVETTLTAARELRRMIATQAAQLIGGTLTFSDNDGD